MAGGIVYQLNGGGGFEKDAIEIIVDYAYTGRCVLADDNTKNFVISSYYTAVYESTVGDFAVKVSLAMKIQTLSGCPSSAN